MQSPLLSHALATEFPELADAIHHLKTHNAHFKKLMDEHASIDQQITASEEGIKALDDTTMKNLKVKRLHLKEELHQMARNHKN